MSDIRSRSLPDPSQRFRGIAATAGDHGVLPRHRLGRVVGLGRRFRGITPVGPELLELQAVIGDADELTKFLALVAVVVTPTATVAISREPDDDRLVEAALAAHADVIVTGDRDLLTLGLVDQIEILTPREFLQARQPSG